MKNKFKIAYWVVTGLFSLMMLGGVAQYFFMHDTVSEMFINLQFPPYLIYLMGTAKLLGIVAIWTNLSPELKEWAYAGFTFNLLLAVSAHINIGDGEWIGAAMALVLLLASYFLGRKVAAEHAQGTA